MVLVTQEDIDTLARTIYGEARGEYLKPEGGLASLIAVANVVMNRVYSRKKFGSTIHEVCTKPYQFSCWNPNDPNHHLISTLKAGQNEVTRLCWKVAESVANGSWPDLSKGSDHYFSSTMSKIPTWALGQKLRIKIGAHLFYKIA